MTNLSEQDQDQFPIGSQPKDQQQQGEEETETGGGGGNNTTTTLTLVEGENNSSSASVGGADIDSPSPMSTSTTSAGGDDNTSAASTQLDSTFVVTTTVNNSTSTAISITEGGGDTSTISPFGGNGGGSHAESSSSTSTTVSADTDDTSTTMNTTREDEEMLEEQSGTSSPIRDQEQDCCEQPSPQQMLQSDDPNSSSDCLEEVVSIEFPVLEMNRLDEMISNPRWVVPVLPGGQLEILLISSIHLAKNGLDIESEPCQKFIREGLTTSFNKILTDDAVSSWKPDIHKCILKNSERLVELIVLKLDQDCLPLLELLAVLFNPGNKFHAYNSTRQPESYTQDDDEVFSQPQELRIVKGWLVDLINLFGGYTGFEKLSTRFGNLQGLTVPLVFAYVRPFGLCAEFLTKHCVEKYFTPIISAIPQFLESLSDDELKKETGRSDMISSIIKCLKALQGRIPETDEDLRSLEIFRLKMILRMLQISSFNGKMNALNEINQVIQNISSHYAAHQYRLDEVEYLSSRRIAEWLSENKVLQIVLRDSLHQPQYVEKLEKILRFIIKERTLTLEDLDDIWAAQMGKHDAIVKNVHDLLAKLAWDFSPDQLDHLFECFQASWTNANNRQREKLLELIRRLAEDDKDGVMALKVLMLFWNLAHSNEVPTEIMDQALAAHVKVLDYSCSQRDNHKSQWLIKSIDQLVSDDVMWVIPAMKHIRDIFQLYPEGSNKNSSALCRAKVLSDVQKDKQLIVKLCDMLASYMDKVRLYGKEKGAIDPNMLKLDGRYSHLEQIRGRLKFLKYLLKEGHLWLCEEQADLIWTCLAENPAYTSDREMCFEWFSKLMGDEPNEQDIEPKVILPFFERKILTFDATLLTETGLDCFEKFFRAVNINQKKLSLKREEVVMDDVELIGTEYIWRVVLSGTEDMAGKAILFLRSIYTALGPKLIANQTAVHEDFLSSCMDRLKASYDTMKVLEKDKDSTNRVRQEVTRACRVLKLLYEYITECDAEYGEERAFIPLYRAARGKDLSIFIRFSTPGSRNFDDVEIRTHTNETPLGLRRHIIRQIRQHAQITTSFKLDVYYNGESIDLTDDRRTIQQFGMLNKMMLTAKVVQNHVPNSPDSSEDSSGGSPNHFPGAGIDGPNIEAEECLPSVMISKNEKRMDFLCQLCGLGASIGSDRLRESGRALLSILPKCRNTERSLSEAFNPVQSTLEKKQYILLFNTDPAVVLYRLEVLYTMLFPAVMSPHQAMFDLQRRFFISGGASMVVEMLTKNNFMPLADASTKRLGYLAVLKLTKLVLAVTSHLTLRVEQELPGHEERARILGEAVKSVPQPCTEGILRQIAEKMSLLLHSFIKQCGDSQTPLKALVDAAVAGNLPDSETIRLLVKLASAAASGSIAYITTAAEQFQANREPYEEDVLVCEEALETLTISFILNPNALEQLINESATLKTFMRQVLFYTQGPSIRFVAKEQFLIFATKATGNMHVITFFTIYLFEIIQNAAREVPQHSREAFFLLSQLLKYSSNFNIPLSKHEQFLDTQILWLRQVKEFMKTRSDAMIADELLEGHICVARDLIGFLNPERKRLLGCDPEASSPLITEVLEEFVFPWSKAYSVMKKSGEISSDECPVQICSTQPTQVSILDLVINLCIGCFPNLKLTVDLLNELFNYNMEGDNAQQDWEYIPPIGNRPMGGFVGLKNAGATCYMNSVLQQLFMVDSIKRGLLEIIVPESEDDISDDLDQRDSTDSMITAVSQTSQSTFDSNAEGRKGYNICILRQLQNIFGHLSLSKLQYYVPHGLWKHFRLQGEAVNPREQQDAVEFFMSLVESVDDGLKAIGDEQIMSKNLGGLFSDQKICKECPHRYSKEEPFCVMSVDIRNHSNLCDSLEQYVKGELLEGADAYHCERCNKKVVTVKRLCVKKLPPVLAIQLKRFEYDYERVCPIKFNDYFEFPRELDMEPYTVSGLAKIEGEMIEADDPILLGQDVCSNYRLTGVVVHSGQASGGHYYSYISHRCPDGIWRWFKFDDGDVSECRMDDDEELKNQCFGGDYAGEVFDHMVKRMSFRRQKRWWNAYILFYTQVDVLDSLGAKFASIAVAEKRMKIPPRIERSVLQQNVEFMHLRSHYSMEYFQFVKKLVMANMGAANQWDLNLSVPEELENLALLSVQMASCFLFTVGFRTKKNLRGIANDWHDILLPYLKLSKKVRFWFATNVFFRDPSRIAEYLLECPSTEVRATFSKLLLAVARFSIDDGVYIPSIPMLAFDRTRNKQLWETILEAVTNLLRRDVSEYGRHLLQYFGFFVNYSTIGDLQKQHLIEREVPANFIMVALEDGPSPPIKYQCADLSKLYQCVSLLVRSCDVSHRCRGSTPESPPKPNPFIEPSLSQPVPLMRLQPTVEEMLYGRGQFNCSAYIKKIVEEAYSADDTVALLQFLSWENFSFSQIALAEILGRVGYSYTTELKTYLEILQSLLRIEDSWQPQRVAQALKGYPDEKDGLIDIIDRNRASHPKKAYLFIKCITNMMERGNLCHKLLQTSADLSRKWNIAVDWLHHELERRGSSTYGYSTTSWSPPSNETSNGSFFLERSLSAKTTLEKAIDLRIEPEQAIFLDLQEDNEEEISSEGEDGGGVRSLGDIPAEVPMSDVVGGQRVVTPRRTGFERRPRVKESANERMDGYYPNFRCLPSVLSTSTGTSPSTGNTSATGVGHWGPSSVCNESLNLASTSTTEDTVELEAKPREWSVDPGFNSSGDTVDDSDRLPRPPITEFYSKNRQQQQPSPTNSPTTTSSTSSPATSNTTTTTINSSTDNLEPTTVESSKPTGVDKSVSKGPNDP